MGDREGGFALKRSPISGILLSLTLAAVLVTCFCALAPAAGTAPYIWITSQPAPAVDLTSVSATSSDDVWAVGTTPTDQGKVLHFNGQEWITSADNTPALHGVSALDATHVWAVGGNYIMFYDGATWKDQSPPEVGIVRSVFALDSSHVWAAGDGEKVYFYDGSTWAATILGGGANALYSVCAIDYNHAWAVGKDGTILAWDGHGWTDQSIGGASTLRSVYGLDYNCAWTVGEGGLVRYWNGTTWTDAAVPGVTAKFSGVFALDVNHVYLGADGGRVFLWNGGAWQAMQTSVDAVYDSITAIDTDHIYLSGKGGAFAYGYSILEAQASTYYFAEGSCRPTFDPYICVQNPGDSVDADVKVTYMLGSGATREQSFTVPEGSRYTVAVKAFLGQGNDAAHDFSAVVTSTNGAPIIAERPMYFSYTSSAGVLITGGSDVMGALQPRPTFYFAEGTCRPTFDSYFCIQNPGGTAAKVKIDYMLGNGAVKTQEVDVAAHARKTVAAKDLLGTGNDDAHDFSARVQTTNGTSIVVERPMYFSYLNAQGVQVTGGHDVVGAPTPAKNFYFAEGTCRNNFDPYICIQNPGQATSQVMITFMLGNGKVVQHRVDVPASSRRTVVVKQVLGHGDDSAHDFSARVQTINGTRVIAERPMYFDYISSAKVSITGGHDVIGALYPTGVFYFAEGTCRPDFDPYVCVQNPGGSDVEVVLTYMLGDGRSVKQVVTVARGSRYTVNVKDKLGSANDAAHDFSAKVAGSPGEIDEIIVERPIYFNYRNVAGARLTGGHDVVGYSP